MQVLDLETMQFEAGPTMEIARLFSLDAERVLVIGGGDDGPVLSSTEVLSVAGEL